MEIIIGMLTLPGIVCEKCWSRTVIYPPEAYEKHFEQHHHAAVVTKRRSTNPSGRPPGKKNVTVYRENIKIR